MIVASKVSRFVLVLAALGLDGPHLAVAGAFLLEPGHWQVISTLRNSTSSSAYDAQGVLRPQKRYGKTEAASLIEYGFDRDVTLLMSPALRFLRGSPCQRGLWCYRR